MRVKDDVSGMLIQFPDSGIMRHDHYFFLTLIANFESAMHLLSGRRYICKDTTYHRTILITAATSGTKLRLVKGSVSIPTPT